MSARDERSHRDDVRLTRPRGKPGRLARPLELERTCTPDREAMLAALRVVLGLPRVIPKTDGGQT